MERIRDRPTLAPPPAPQAEVGGSLATRRFGAPLAPTPTPPRPSYDETVSGQRRAQRREGYSVTRRGKGPLPTPEQPASDAARQQAWRLLQRVADGDDDALRELYRTHQRLAFSLAVRMLGQEGAAEDVVQEAFLRVWRNADRFDPSKAGFPTWLGRIVRNLCVDQLRRKSPLSHGDALGEVERWLAPVPAVDTVVLDRLVVRDAFLQLPRAQSEVLQLSYFQGMTHREIAEALAIPEGTVKSRMRLGLRKMRRHLEEGEDGRGAGRLSRGGEGRS